LEAVDVFGAILRERRLQAGLTQEQLALEADIRRTYVSMLELGQHQPTLNMLQGKTGTGQTAGAIRAVGKARDKKGRRGNRCIGRARPPGQNGGQATDRLTATIRSPGRRTPAAGRPTGHRTGRPPATSLDVEIHLTLNFVHLSLNS
jgi:hypothetical protein